MTHGCIAPWKAEKPAAFSASCWAESIVYTPASPAGTEQSLGRRSVKHAALQPDSDCDRQIPRAGAARRWTDCAIPGSLTAEEAAALAVRAQRLAEIATLRAQA